INTELFPGSEREAAILTFRISDFLDRDIGRRIHLQFGLFQILLFGLIRIDVESGRYAEIQLNGARPSAIDGADFGRLVFNRGLFSPRKSLCGSKSTY